MAVLFILEFIISFIMGFSRYSKGSLFTPVVKLILNLLAWCALIGCIVMSIVRHFWWGIAIAVIVAFGASYAGIRLYVYIRNRS